MGALVWVLACGFPSGCEFADPGASSGQEPWRKVKSGPGGETHLSEAEAVRIASNAAIREGRNLADYQPPLALYSRSKTEDSWAVSFKGKSQKPGDHFVVQVDDRTGWTRFFAGR